MPHITYDRASNLHDGVTEEFSTTVDDAIEIAEDNGILIKDITFSTDFHHEPESERDGTEVGVVD